MANRLPCYVCGNAAVRRATIRLANVQDENFLEIVFVRRREAGLPEAPIMDETRACITCNIGIRREVDILLQNPDCLRLNIITPYLYPHCFVCRGRNNVHRLSIESRVDIFFKRNIYVPDYFVCCNNHLNTREFLVENLIEGLRYVNRPYVIRGPELYTFLQAMREEIRLGSRRRYEDENGMSDEEFRALSPLSKVDFNDLFTYCDAVPIPGGHRYVSKKDLLCFLCKLRQGLSDEFLYVMFQYSSRQSTSLAVATVRQSLMLRFVPENIGFQSITREEYIRDHVTEFSNRLYNETPEEPKAIIYNDCTYLYIEKSLCFKALRQSFCVHKGRHALKPAMFVAPNGYILDIQGPYFSNAANSDGRILLSQFELDTNGMREWLRRGDIFVLDCGYREVIAILQRMGVITKMPSLLRPNESQLSTEEANHSRIVTKTRWIVEARNGHLKSIFKFFSNIINTAHIPSLNDFLRIAGAIINKYFDEITMPDADEHLAEEMLNRYDEINVV